MAPLAKKVPDPCYRQKRESLGFSDNNTTIIKSPVFWFILIVIDIFP